MMQKKATAKVKRMQEQGATAVQAAIQRYANYAPDVATNNYCPYPEPDEYGVYPYAYGMLVWPDMRVRDGEVVYKCILPDGTYKLVYSPSQVPSVFEVEE